MADFVEKLAALMEAKGHGQSSLSRASGVPQTTISNYIHRRARPSWEAVQSLAAALGVTCADLTDDDLPPPPDAPPAKPRGRPPVRASAPPPEPPPKKRPRNKS